MVTLLKIWVYTRNQGKNCEDGVKCVVENKNIEFFLPQFNSSWHNFRIVN